jgi:BirA family biotin operon repressor/biotin-[acetyl-CoA-carboxylase] ligase
VSQVNEGALFLLQLLKNADTPLSGEVLAREQGISRVALWKRVEALRAAGYAIEAGHSGYLLLPGDKPLPWEFPAGGVVHFDTVASTMDEARRLALAGVAEAAVVAEHQTAGRGRADRTWSSPGGDLLVTLIVRPDLPVSFAGALALEALAAMADTLDELYGLDVELKWPNDLTWDGRKMAGALVEAWGGPDRPLFYTVGLGLNVHGLPTLDRPVTSVDALGARADRRAILSSWRTRVNRWAAAPTPDPARWAQRARFGRRFDGDTFDGRHVEGLSFGFDRAGDLLLARPDSTLSIRYGELRRTTGATS